MVRNLTPEKTDIYILGLANIRQREHHNNRELYAENNDNSIPKVQNPGHLKAFRK